MNKIMLVIITLLSAQAFATKARIASMGNSFHITDAQGIYSNAMRVVQFSNLVMIESGLTAATSTTNNAEGGVFFNVGENERMALTLGNNNDLVQNGRRFINSIVGANTYETPQNMVHVFYGSKGGSVPYGVGLFYSNKDDKLNSLTESSSGLLASFKFGSFGIFGSYSLVNSVEAAANRKFDGGGAFKLAGRYMKDDIYYGVDFGSWISKSSTGAVENEAYGNKSMSFRVIHSIKKDGNELFYGAGVMSNAIDCKTKGSATCTTKFSSLTFPIIIGTEISAADWITLRGTITQSLPIDTVKDEIGLPAAATSGIAGTTGAVTDFSGQANTTTLAMGAGIKFNKITIDGSMTTATTQTIDGTTLLTQVGLTYNY